jgi:hypothetical protein
MGQDHRSAHLPTFDSSGGWPRSPTDLQPITRSSNSQPTENQERLQGFIRRVWRKIAQIDCLSV